MQSATAITKWQPYRWLLKGITRKTLKKCFLSTTRPGSLGFTEGREYHHAAFVSLFHKPVHSQTFTTPAIRSHPNMYKFKLSQQY